LRTIRLANADADGHGDGDSYRDSDADGYTDFNSFTLPVQDAFAYASTDASAAAHSASPPDTPADACRLPASYSGTALITYAYENEAYYPIRACPP
jgi:hypothetical protein